MVVGTADPAADVIFVVEGTAINGAYLNDIKSNYIIPTLEYFCQGTLEERDYICESTSALYGIVIYHAADRLPSPSVDIYGPYANPLKVLQVLDKIEVIGGRGESHANIAEALAASLICLEDLQQRRETGITPQKHCVLVCNSPPYLMPVTENHAFAGNTAEQLASLFTERNVHLSILSPRKIPALFKLYEKAGGDLSASQTKNYAKDPRHLVLLKGFSLKERPVSPSGGGVHNPLGVASLPSPLPSHGSPMAQVSQPQQTQANQQQPTILQGGGGGAPAGSRGFVGPGGTYPRPRWPMMPPQQRPGYSQQPGSALIEQLTRPPSIAPQFNNSGGMNPATGAMSQPQQQQQQAVAVAAVQQQQMRMLPQPVMTQAPQPGVMQQPQQQPGMLNQQQTILLAQTQQMPQQGVIGQPQQPTQVLAQNSQSAQSQLGRERQVIWQGVVEWMEKPKIPNDPQKLTRQVACQVSAATKDGEPELKADSWPQKLLMQLMPKTLIGTVGGSHLKNSKSVYFHPQNSEGLEALTKVMSTGFAGCVHFNSVGSGCDLKVLILLYTAEKRNYLGFIPNDQSGFIDRLRKIIQQQKTTGLTRQGQVQGGGGGQGGPNMGGGQGPSQPPNPTMGTLLQQQPSIAQQQTINQSLGGNPVAQPGPMMGALQNDASQQQGQVSNNQGGGQPGFNNHMVEAARQENLVKIQRLRQTLEAAQQQELQYKNQLEIMNHMKIQQMQDSLQHAQQQEIKFQTLEQEQQKQLRAQLQQMQQQGQGQGQGQPQQGGGQQVRGIAPQQAGAPQQRMMRPAISNNPGLRHLLQQPQYRLNMSQQMPRPGLQQTPGQQQNPQQQQQFEDVGSYDFLG